jgi:hypothetical protein
MRALRQNSASRTGPGAGERRWDGFSDGIGLFPTGEHIVFPWSNCARPIDELPGPLKALAAGSRPLVLLRGGAMESMPRLRPVLGFGLGMALMLQPAGPGAQAASVVLTPSRDNSMYSEGANSNGAGQHLFSGTTSFGGRRRALLAFDVAGSLPAGATIESAALQLHISLSPPGATSHAVSIHRLLADWGEGGADAEGNEGTGAPALPGDATWTDRIFPGTLWTTPGGDFVVTASASQLVPPTLDAFATWGSTAAMVADVQAWLDAPASNLGWLVIGDETQLTTARRFDSRENETAANHPTLMIEYTPGAGVGAVPDGDDVPGTPLRMAKAGGAVLSFSWGGSCSGGATDYAVYEGPLGNPFTAHKPLACSTGGATSATLTPTLAGSSYFLVVPHDATVEGSYGRNSAEVERPQGPDFCVPQELSTCP